MYPCFHLNVFSKHIFLTIPSTSALSGLEFNLHSCYTVQLSTFVTYIIMNMFLFILIVKRLEASGHWALYKHDKSVFIIIVINIIILCSFAG